MANWGGGLQGGLGGATAGAAFGPIGAGIGGALGFLGGLFTGGDQEPATNPNAVDPAAFGYRTGPTPGAGGYGDILGNDSLVTGGGGVQYATGEQLNDPFIAAARAQQEAQRQRILEAIGAMRDAPSAARLAAQAQAQRIGQQAFGMAAAQPRFNPATYRAAINAQTGAMQGMAGDVATAAAQERQARLAAALQAEMGLRGQDQNLMAAELAKQRAFMDYWKGLEGIRPQWGQQSLEAQKFNAAARMRYQELMSGRGESQAGRSQQTGATNAQNSQNQFLGILGAAGSLGKAVGTMPGGNKTATAAASGSGSSDGSWWDWPKSDVRAKRNIRPAGDEYQQFLGALAEQGASGYQYRPGFGAGQGFGPMAQGLEQAGPVGESMVRRDGKGMREIDGGKAITAMLGAIAEQQRQINALRAGSPFAETDFLSAPIVPAPSPVVRVHPPVPGAPIGGYPAESGAAFMRARPWL